LRERSDDVVELGMVFLERLRARYAKDDMRFDAESLNHLRMHTWPERSELENNSASCILAERRSCRSDRDNRFARCCASRRASRDTWLSNGEAAAIASFETEYLRRLLAESNGNLSTGCAACG